MLTFANLLADYSAEDILKLFWGSFPFSFLFILAIGGGAVGLSAKILTSVTEHLRMKHMVEMEAMLKMDMLARGMSADEIERVLSARLSSHSELLSSR